MKKKIYREKYHEKEEKTKKKKISKNIAEDPIEIANNTPNNNKVFAFKGLIDKSKKNNKSEKSEK